MEKIRPGKSENKKSDFEKKESRESFMKKARKLFVIWTFSAIASFAPMKSMDAQTEKDSLPIKTEKIVVPSAEFKKGIEAQEKWLEEYIQSPKCRERLSKEYVRMGQMPNNSIEEFSAAFEKPVLDENGDTSYIVNAFDGYVRSMKENLPGYNLDSAMCINEVFPDVEVSNLSEISKGEIDLLIESRLQMLRSGNVVFVDSVRGSDGQVVFGSYNTKTNEVHLPDSLPENQSTTGLHEKTHQSLYGSRLIYRTTKYILSRYANRFRILQDADRNYC